MHREDPFSWDSMGASAAAPSAPETFDGTMQVDDQQSYNEKSGFGLSYDGKVIAGDINRKGFSMKNRVLLISIAIVALTCMIVGTIILTQESWNKNSANANVALAPDDDPTSSSPSNRPTEEPTMGPTKAPFTAQAISGPTTRPTTRPPSSQPTGLPSQSPSEPLLTEAPTAKPTVAPVPSTNGTNVTFVPGDLVVEEVGLSLSRGLRARIIATTGQSVKYHDGSTSSILFHGQPDFGATFVDTRSGNPGGWVYVSNSEINITGAGGVGSITFDKNGNIIDYRMVLEGSTHNCGGGRTPWNTWISCEEVEFFGEIYQVDPFGEIPAQKATIGSQLGRWESFAYDNRNSSDPRFFVTEDHSKGTVRRFRPDPSQIDWDNPWDMLHVTGTIDYLVVNPNSDHSGGTFVWTSSLNFARENAKEYYPQTEGIDVYNGIMYLVCKKWKLLFVFDLDAGVYYNQTSVTGLFDGGPDQMQRILDDDPGDLLYFTEEGGVNAGVHARDNQDRYYTIMEGPLYTDETTGLAFSPNGKHLYVAYQNNGLLFDIWREDGYSFGGLTLNVKYHQT